MTWADILMFDVLSWLIHTAKSGYEFGKNHESLKNVCMKVKDSPKIAAWLAKRPESAM